MAIRHQQQQRHRFLSTKRGPGCTQCALSFIEQPCPGEASHAVCEAPYTFWAEWDSPSRPAPSRLNLLRQILVATGCEDFSLKNRGLVDIGQ